MSSPYVGEIRMFAGNFAPSGWMFCDGSTLPISENDTLFNLIGTTYGGDGQSTFNIPNLSSRVPVHMGTLSGVSYPIGQVAGTEQETISVATMPAHNHPLQASANTGTATPPGGNVLGVTGAGISLYYEGQPNNPMNAASVTPLGGGQPHENVQPFLCINFIISLFGIYPSPT